MYNNQLIQPIIKSRKQIHINIIILSLLDLFDYSVLNKHNSFDQANQSYYVCMKWNVEVTIYTFSKLSRPLILASNCKYNNYLLKEHVIFKITTQTVILT